VSSEHHIVLWDHQQMASTDKPHDPYVMRVSGWACSSCRTWGAEGSPRARTHAVERHVGGLPDPFNTDNLVRMIERWWEEEASYTADCAAPDPSLCPNHVFEEAVRVDGEIVACTVHGGRLARSMAAYLVARQKELEDKIRQIFERDAARSVERWRRLNHGTWTDDTHAPGCGAGRSPERRCICHLGRENRKPMRGAPGCLPCATSDGGVCVAHLHRPDAVDESDRPTRRRECTATALGGDGCLCLTPDEHYSPRP
jgi:hypothetical protein